MLARLSAFLVWALVAAATAYWGLRVLVRPGVLPVNATAISDATQLRGDWSRLMGAEVVPEAAAAPAMSTRFKLLGVVAGQPGATAAGVALISIDGKPPRAFRAGSRIEEDLVLQGLGQRSAAIGSAQGKLAFTLELPTLPEPARGTLPHADGIPGGITMVREPAPVPPMQPAQAAPIPAMPAPQMGQQPMGAIPQLNVVDVPGLAPQ